MAFAKVAENRVVVLALLTWDFFCELDFRTGPIVACKRDFLIVRASELRGRKLILPTQKERLMLVVDS